MIKRPNAQTPKRLLAVLLALLVLYGCKRHLLETELLPPVAVISTKHIKNAKNWFDKNKPDFSSANARINIDSVRYKEFFPVWQLSKTHTLASGDTLIVVPIQRNFQIEYTEVGFLRRLCLYIQNDNVKSAKIIELISDKPTLKTNEDLIFKNIETGLNGGTISNIDVAVLQYDLAYKHEKGKVFVAGKGVTDVSLSMNNASRDNARGGGTEGIIMMASGEIPWEDDKPGPRTFGGNNGGGGGGGGSTNSPSSDHKCPDGYVAVWEGTPPNRTLTCVRIPLTGGVSFPLPTTNLPNYPNLPNFPIIIQVPKPPIPPPLTPIPTIPVPPPTTIFIPIGGSGGGGSTAPNPPPECMPSSGTMGVGGQTTTILPTCTGVDNGGNTEPEVEPEVSLPPPGVTKDTSMTNPNNAEINCIYEKLIKQKNIKQLLSLFGPTTGLKLIIKVGTLQGTTRGETSVINNNEVIITISRKMQANGTNEEDIYSSVGIAKTIAHEIMHARLRAWVKQAGGFSYTSGLLIPSNLPGIHALMLKYKANGRVDLNRVDHEYIAKEQLATLIAIMKEYDNDGISTQTEYESLAWDGLHLTDVYRNTYNETQRSVVKATREGFISTKRMEGACE